MTKKPARAPAALALLSLLTAACGPGGGATDAATDAASDASEFDGAATSEAGAPDAANPCPRPAEPEDMLPTPELHTPRWAFEPWISKDISSDADTREFVRGFRERDIPVGVVVLDSPWETNYNTFVPNPSRYPNFDRLVNDLHADNIRVVLWITQMVNSFSVDFETGGDLYEGASPNYAEGRACGYYVNNGAQYQWWKGRGAGVDFFNPRARRWWHQQQDPLLALGIDGWKLDFGESYITTPMVRTAMGEVPHQRYSEEYYRDFLAYGVARRGRDNFVTMVRPWDESYTFAGRFFARREHAPVAWVGDNRRDWVGLSDALDHIFRSAAAGYVVVGSDVGGYLDFDDRNMTVQVPANQDAFARWTAMGALTPFFQLHGRANLAPWTVPERTEETVRLYRYWSKLHHELVPFFYSLSEECHRSACTVVRPQGAMASWPGDYRFAVGDAFFVAPVLDGAGRRDVALPAGRYYDWWNPSADAVNGGQTLRGVDTSNRERIPLYVRAGAIVPMEVSDAVTGVGSSASRGALTILAYPSAEPSRFALHDTDNARVELALRQVGDATEFSLPRALRPVLLRVREDARFASVAIGETPVPFSEDRAGFDAAAGPAALRDPASRSVWVKLPPAMTPRTVRLVLR